MRFFITEGQVSDYTGSDALRYSPPTLECLLAERGYDADWFRDALTGKSTRPGILGRTSRGKPIPQAPPNRSNRIDVTFGLLKDWQRVTTRNDRRPKVFLSAATLAATVMFSLLNEYNY